MIASRLLRLSSFALMIATFGSSILSAQSAAAYAGMWKLNSQMSEPKRDGEVTLKIRFEDPKLIVELLSVRASSPPRHATQTYSLDGNQTTWIGADGDRFDATVEGNNGSLVFSIVEHEDGRTLRSTETWTLTDDGQRIKRTRNREGKPTETFVYDKQPLQ